VQNAHGAVDFARCRGRTANDLIGRQNLLALNQAMRGRWKKRSGTANVMPGRDCPCCPRHRWRLFRSTERHPRAEQILRKMGARLVTEIASPGVEAYSGVICKGSKSASGRLRRHAGWQGWSIRAPGVRRGR